MRTVTCKASSIKPALYSREFMAEEHKKRKALKEMGARDYGPASIDQANWWLEVAGRKDRIISYGARFQVVRGKTVYQAASWRLLYDAIVEDLVEAYRLEPTDNCTYGSGIDRQYVRRKVRA